MANNQYVNKVVYDGNTLIDISDSTVEAGDVKSGKDFYAADGSKITGTADFADASVSGKVLTLTDGFPISLGIVLPPIIWKEPINLTFSDSNALADCLSYVEAENYPFFKLVGFTRRKTAGDYTGNSYVYFYATNSELPSINAQYGVLNNRQLVAPSGNYPNNLSISVDTVLDTSTSGHEGQLRLRYNRINTNYRQYYGDNFIYWIDKNRCSQDSIFYNLPYVRSSESI